MTLPTPSRSRDWLQVYCFKEVSAFCSHFKRVGVSHQLMSGIAGAVLGIWLFEIIAWAGL
jgi:hypothetical protein